MGNRHAARCWRQWDKGGRIGYTRWFGLSCRRKNAKDEQKKVDLVHAMMRGCTVGLDKPRQPKKKSWHFFLLACPTRGRHQSEHKPSLLAPFGSMSTPTCVLRLDTRLQLTLLSPFMVAIPSSPPVGRGAAVNLNVAIVWRRMAG